MGFAPRGQLFELFQIAPGDLVKKGSKCSFTVCKLRFFALFCLLSHSPERISTAC
jgi:hypothetical protein